MFRYFAVTSASIGVLTDGVRYRFFSDVDEANKLDREPFLELDLSLPGAIDTIALAQFAFPQTGPESMRRRARALKITRDIRVLIAAEFKKPSTELVRLFAGRSVSGTKTRTVIDELRPLVKTALRQVVDERARRVAADTANRPVPTKPPKPVKPSSSDRQKQPELQIRSRITGFTLHGTRVPVRFWNHMLVLVAEECWRRRPEEFASNVAGMGGPTRDVVGKDPDRMLRPRPIGDSDFFITVNVSAQTALRHAIEILHRCGFSDSDLTVHTD